MTTSEYLKQCKEIDCTIGELRSKANSHRTIKWLSSRDIIESPKTRWDYMIDTLIQQKEVLRKKRDHALRYGYGFGK